MTKDEQELVAQRLRKARSLEESIVRVKLILESIRDYDNNAITISISVTTEDVFIQQLFARMKREYADAVRAATIGILEDRIYTLQKEYDEL
jgi:hypothetical protein